ncbi:autotransporter-associated beta strand repeat-containing protein [Thiohalocapsa sp. ML1]|uniref:beta strand repeat-containing protein n=1 Tax=Thiohalocapsa sp. ML1 TaxID=1431688 RepID=UPI0007320877|nr:autotransporter-associated beta strand repeat-containing protein [Thiohalocapsa sp. ML1]
MRLLTMTQGTYTAPAPAARRASLAVAISAVLAGAVGVRANAAEIFLQGADGPNESSFTTTTNSWGAGGANDPNHPNADDDYNSNGYLLRTPRVSTPETFAGKSLTIGGGAGGATGVMVLLSGGGAGAAVTVDDLRANNGRLSVSSDTSQTLNGVVTVLAGGLEINGSQANRTIDMGARLRGSGGITVRAIQGAGGTVVFRDATNDYTGNLTVESGAILRQSVSGALSSAGSGVVNVAGTLQLRTGAGEATASTDASINGLTGGGTVTNGNTASTLTIDGDGTTVFSGGISGSQFGITKTGSGSQTFAGDNTYEGETTVQGGRLIAASATALGDTSGGTTIDSAGGTVELAGATTSEPFTLEARVDDSTAHLDATGASSSEIDASGSITLADGDGDDPAHFNITTNTTTGTGVFTIAAEINGTGAAAAEQNLNFGGGADGEGVVSGAVNMDTDATTNLNVSAASWDFSGALNDVDNLNVSGGLATLSNTAKTIGTVDVTGGTLDLATGLTTSNTVSVGPGGALTQTGSNISASQSGGYDVEGIVSLNGDDATMTSLTGSGIVQNDDDAGNGTNTLTIDTDTSQSFTGTLRDGDGSGGDGTLALTKRSSGSQTLSGNNTYTGDTLVEGGRLIAASNTALGDTSGGTTIAYAGGTVELAGVTTSEPFTLEARADATTAHLDATGASSSEIDASGSITLADGDGDDPAHFNITTNTTTGTGVFTIAAEINGTGAAAAEQNLNFGGGADGEGVVSGAVNMDTDATTNLNVSAASWDFSGALSDVDNLNVSGGLATLSNTAKTIGTVDVTGGTLDLATGLTTSNTVTVGPDGALTQTGSNISASQSGGYDVEGIVSLNGDDATMTSLTGSGIVQNDDDAGNGTNTLTIDTDTSQSFTGTLRDGDGSGGDGTLALTKTGSGTQTLTGTNTFDGLTTVEDGALNIQNAAALGSTVGDTDVKESGRVELQGGISVDEVFNLYATDTGSVQLSNVADANSITAAVNLVDSDPVGGEQFRIDSESGTLNLDGGVVSSLSGGDEILNLGGAGNGTVESLSMTTADASSIVKDGDGEWTVSDATITNANEIVSQGGVLALADAANIDGDAIFKLAGGTLAVEDVTGGSSFDSDAFRIKSGQSLVGNGLVTGDIVVESGATVAPGSSIGSMAFDGNLTLNGTLETEISDTQIDFIDVNGAFDITSATLDLVVLATPFLDWLVLAEYDTLPTAEFFEINISSGWEYQIDYDYDDGASSNNIAVFVTRSDIPAPTPLALIGLGILVWAGARGRTRGAKTA